MTRPAPVRGRLAWRGLAALSAAATGLLLLSAGRYGYHRDELYFLRAGAEPAFGYVDQPPLTPLIARALQVLFPDSLVALRTPSAVMGGLVVLLTGVIARELGARRAAQVLAAAAIGVAAAFAAITHLLSTSTLDLLVWVTLSWLLVRALRDGGRVWIAVGLVAGVGLQNKTLVAFLLGAVLLGVLAVGPREVLRGPGPWAAAGIALLIWAPHLVWQAQNGWPVIELSRAIAGGASGTSEPWYLFLPFQLVLVSPVLVPVWAVGWWRLLRDPALERWRAFAVAYALLAVVFLVTGGKPYYLFGLYPVLLAAGAGSAMEWARRRADGVRTLAVALTVTLASSAVLFLPVLPPRWLAATPVLEINYDAGETVGWPELAATVAGVRAGLPAGERTAVLARNYGQAGAVDHFLPDLAPAHSPQLGYWTWGPPPEDADTLIVLGFDEADLRSWFGRVQLAARVDNRVGLENDEQGTPVWVVSGRRVPWAELWPQLGPFDPSR